MIKHRKCDLCGDSVKKYEVFLIRNPKSKKGKWNEKFIICLKCLKENEKVL